MNETSPGQGSTTQPTEPLPPREPWAQDTRPLPGDTGVTRHGDLFSDEHGGTADDVAGTGAPHDASPTHGTRDHGAPAGGSSLAGATASGPSVQGDVRGSGLDSRAAEAGAPARASEPPETDEPAHPWRPFSPRTVFFGTLDLVVDGFLNGAVLILLVTLVSTGIALVPALGVGVLVIVAALYLAAAAVWLERRRAASAFGVDLRDPRRRRSERRDWTRAPHQLWLDATDGPLWLGLLHMLVTCCLGLVVIMSLAGIGGAVAGALSPLYAPGNSVIRHAAEVFTVPGWGPLPLWAWSLLAVLAALVGLVLIALCVLAHRGLSVGLLRMSRSAELRRQAAEQTRRAEQAAQERESAVRGAHTERSRIERDLHDGVQPQLVSVAMNLSMARSRIDTDPESAKELVSEAHGTTKAAITELRRLARGFHPAVLEDRGLDAALTAVAAQAPFPVDVSVRVPRLSPETEAAVYFAVSESLTNAIKHSGARAADVAVSLQNGAAPCATVVVAGIRDWGRGGARVVPGGGLSGIEDRIRSAGGRFHLISPMGGPTEVIVQLPVAPRTPPPPTAADAATSRPHGSSPARLGHPSYATDGAPTATEQAGPRGGVVGGRNYQDQEA